MEELICHIPLDDSFEKPSFDANLPADVRYDSNLSPLAKLLYCEIRALSSKYGFCYAKNSYFEKCYEIDERTVRRLLQQLRENGYIAIFKARNDVDGKIYRIIQIAGSKFTESPPEKKRTKMSEKSGQKCPKKTDKNVRHELNKYNTYNINFNKIHESKGKVKNKFKNFSEREYSASQMEQLEQAMLMRASP